MGPQLVRCGKLAARTMTGVTSGLQWGRNLFVAESVYRRPDTTALGYLQWGRNLFVAESHYYRRIRPNLSSFNGAATCSLRKGAIYVQVPEENIQPSMGPQLVRCGKQQ